MTADEKPYRVVPSSQPLRAAQSDQAQGRGFCKRAFRKRTRSMVPGAGDWPRGAALRPPRSLVPEDCAAQWDLHARTAGLQVPKPLSKLSGGGPLAGLLFNLDLSLQMAPIII